MCLAVRVIDGSFASKSGIAECAIDADVPIRITTVVEAGDSTIGSYIKPVKTEWGREVTLRSNICDDKSEVFVVEDMPELELRRFDKSFEMSVVVFCVQRHIAGICSDVAFCCNVFALSEGCASEIDVAKADYGFWYFYLVLPKVSGNKLYTVGTGP